VGGWVCVQLRDAHTLASAPFKRPAMVPTLQVTLKGSTVNFHKMKTQTGQ
jgi:hypothetical protein